MLAITPDPTGHFTRKGHDLHTVKLAAGYIPAFLQDGRGLLDCLHGHFTFKRASTVHYGDLTKMLIVGSRMFYPLVEAVAEKERLVIFGDYCVHINMFKSEPVTYIIQPTEATMKLQLKV